MRMDGEEYAARNRLIQELFGQTYAEYLQSALWERIRQEVLRRFCNRCAVCRDLASQVHHSRYTTENLLGKSYSHLSALCWRCHKAIERDNDGTKRSPKAVNDLFVVLKKVDANPPRTNGKTRWRLTDAEFAERVRYESKDEDFRTRRKKQRNGRKGRRG